MQSTRRLRRFFYEVDGAALDGQGYALTLTVRDLPPSAADWTTTRETFFKRLRRADLLRAQWLTEFQARGVPHLHGCTFFEDDDDRRELVMEHWLAAAARYRPRPEGQVVKELWGLPGWLQYQAKHSARGVRHYQRASVPEAWRTGTGRLWGVLGDWPTRRDQLVVEAHVFWRFRRLMRGWLISHARADENHPRVAWLRGMLSDPDRLRSRVRAMGEFCPEAVSLQLLHAAIVGTQASVTTSSVGPPSRGPERFRDEDEG
jgi:hypothetical protein